MKKEIKDLKRQNKQSGFTLIEIVLVLVILGGLAIATMQSFNDTDETSKAQTEIQHLQSLTGSIRHMFKTQGTYAGLANDVITASVSFPESMKVNGDTSSIKHSWLSSGVTVESATQTSTDDSFSITYTEVPVSACTAIVSGVYRNFDITNFGSESLTKYENEAVPTIAAGCGTNVSTQEFVDIEFIAR